jgi:hypothetical protein
MQHELEKIENAVVQTDVGAIQKVADDRSHFLLSKQEILKITKLHPSNFWKILKIHHAETYNLIIKLDGNSFSEKTYKWIHGVLDIPTCLCGKKKKYIGLSLGYYNSCRECNSKKNILKAIQAAKTDSTKIKRKTTMLKKYGVTTAIKLPTAIENKNKSLIDKFDTVYPFKIKSVREKIKYTRRNNFIKSCFIGDRCAGFSPLFSPSEFSGIGKDYKFECVTCKTATHCHMMWGTTPRCPKCNPNSLLEDKLDTLIRQVYFGEIRRNTRDVLISGLELDFYFPASQIAIELNGLYWHSNKFKSPYYHMNKFLECERAGVKLYQIFENEMWVEDEILKKQLREWISGTQHESMFLPDKNSVFVESLTNPSVSFMKIAGAKIIETIPPQPCNKIVSGGSEFLVFDAGKRLWKISI